MKSVKAPLLAAVLAAAFAAPALADSGPTFEQVLAAPDDVDLNLAYARAQADEGHLLPAAAALERVLMNHANAHSVRLVYGVILYRLGDLQGARTQLAMVDPSQLTDLQRKELSKYRRIVGNADGNSHFNGQLAAGVSYDSDAFGALYVLPSIPGFSFRQQGTAAVFSGGITGTTRVGEDLDLYGTVDGFSRTHLSGFKDKLQYGEAELGLKKTNLWSSWQLGAVFSHYQLFGDPYLTEYGGRGQFDWRSDTATTWTLGGLAVWQNYHEPLIDFFAPFIGGTHDGWRYDLHGSVAYKIDGHSSIGATLGYEGKNASYDPFAYDEPYFLATYHNNFGRGIYLDLAADARLMQYRKLDWFFLGTKRRDERAYLRAALGVPLSAFSAEGATGDCLEDIDIEGAVTYSLRNEKQPLADYHDTGAELRIVWHFGDER